MPLRIPPRRGGEPAELRHRVQAGARVFETPLFHEFLPYRARILARRGDADDGGFVAGAERAAADSRIVIEPSQLPTFLEGVVGTFEDFWGGRFGERRVVAS